MGRKEDVPSKFDRIRSGVTLFGKTTTPLATCHPIRTFAGLTLCFLAISTTCGCKEGEWRKKEEGKRGKNARQGR
jgi:hypothetical protein